jgi:prevent-host-death family protein
MKATVLDLRYRTKDILKAVERGQTVTVLYRGKETALIQPIRPASQRHKLSEDKAFGIWKDRKDLRDVAAFVRKLRKSRIDDV